MKKFFLFYLAIILGLVSCNSSEEDSKSNKIDVRTISGRVELPTQYLDDCFVTSLFDEQSISSNGSFKLEANTNGLPEIIYVSDEEDNIYLMSRTVVSSKTDVILNAESTTIAFVTLHPALSPEIKTYSEIVKLIKGSTKYQPLYEQIEKAIEQHRNIYDPDNEELLIALSDLLEDIYGEEDEFEYQYVDTLTFASEDEDITRVAYETPRLDPTFVEADIQYSDLRMRLRLFTPTYSGRVYHAGKEIDKFNLPCRNDFGGMDLLKGIKNIQYSDWYKYTMKEDGEYNFVFDRYTLEARTDFILRIVNCILSTVNMELGPSLLKSMGTVIVNMIEENHFQLYCSSYSAEYALAFLGMTYEYILVVFKDEAILKELGLKGDKIKILSKAAGRLFSAFNVYNKIKGSVNLAARIGYGLAAPINFQFCLCKYKNNVSTCSTSSLSILSGNWQEGYSQQKLMEPLQVYVSTIDENGTVIDAPNYQLVKFSVVEGKGKVSGFDSIMVSINDENIASVNWRMGREGHQKVRAVVVDVITRQEISEPVIFDADVIKAQVTVRLEWTQHSGNTDIDLHVIDPFGERICYYHSYAESGGFLDRDDTHGPGPEHIHWQNAPAGDYKIYVHYYPNEDKDRSVVSFEVLVYSEGRFYAPVKRSIAYDQMVYVGRFTVGDHTTRSSLYEDIDVEPYEYPTNMPDKRTLDNQFIKFDRPEVMMPSR